jgi:hypothetical protein
MAQDGIQPISEEVKNREQIVDVVFEGKTERERFIKQLRAEQRKQTIAREPFSYRAAKDDFIEEQRRQFAKHGTRAGKSEADVKVDKFNLKKYSDKSRFNLLRKTPINERKLLDGIAQQVETGLWFDYQDKTNGHRISVEVPHKSPVNKG